LGRFVQGLGSGSFVVLSFAILRDLYAGDTYAQKVSLLSLFSGTSVVVSPFIGGYIQSFLGWRSEFAALLIYSVFWLLACLFFMKESLQHKDNKGIFPVKEYVFLLKDRQVLLLLISVGLLFAIISLLNAMLPFLFIDKLGISPSHYGNMVLFNGLGFMAGTILANRLVKKLGLGKLVKLGLLLFLVLAVVMTIIGLMGHLTWLVVLIPTIIMMIGIGIAFPLCSAGVIQPYPQKSGFSAALLGFMMGVLSIISTLIASALHEQNQIPLGICLIVTAVLCLIFFAIGYRNVAKRPRTQP